LIWKPKQQFDFRDGGCGAAKLALQIPARHVGVGRPRLGNVARVDADAQSSPRSPVAPAEFDRLSD